MSRIVGLLTRDELESLGERAVGASGQTHGLRLWNDAGQLLEAGERIATAVRDPLARVEVAVVHDGRIRTMDLWIGGGLTVAHPRSDGERQPVWLAPAHAAPTMIGAIAGLVGKSVGPAAAMVVRPPKADGSFVLGDDLGRWVGITIATGASADRLSFGVLASTGALVRFRLAENGSAIGEPVDVLDLWAALSPLAALIDAFGSAVLPNVDSEARS